MWYIKQLFPFKYHSKYKDAYGNSKVSIWRQWFGKVFKHEVYDIKG